MNGSRLGLYSFFKNLHHRPDSFAANSIAGAISGTIGAVVANPLYLLKTRLQAQAASAGLAVGHQFGYDGALDGFRRILASEGVRGLYRGVSAAALRIALGSSLQLPLYETVKKSVAARDVVPAGAPRHAVSVLLATCLTTAITNPLDVIRTRLYGQPRAADGSGTLYRGVVHCAWRVVSTEGVLALYKAWPAHFLRIGPHAVLTFVLWEKFRLWGGGGSAAGKH